MLTGPIKSDLVFLAQYGTNDKVSYLGIELKDSRLYTIMLHSKGIFESIPDTESFMDQFNLGPADLAQAIASCRYDILQTPIMPGSQTKASSINLVAEWKGIKQLMDKPLNASRVTLNVLLASRRDDEDSFESTAVLGKELDRLLMWNRMRKVGNDEIQSIEEKAKVNIQAANLRLGLKESDEVAALDEDNDNIQEANVKKTSALIDIDAFIEGICLLIKK